MTISYEASSLLPTFSPIETLSQSAESSSDYLHRFMNGWGDERQRGIFISEKVCVEY